MTKFIELTVRLGLRGGAPVFVNTDKIHSFHDGMVYFDNSNIGVVEDAVDILEKIKQAESE